MYILETNDTTLNVEIQSRPIYVMYDSAWLDSIKKLSLGDSRYVEEIDRESVKRRLLILHSARPSKKGKFSLSLKLHATSAHIVLPFPKKEGTPYFPSRFGKHNWLIDLYMDNLKVTHAAIGNIGNGKIHMLADSVISYFGMKYENGKIH